MVRDHNPYVVLGHRSAGFVHARCMEDAVYIMEKLRLFHEIVCIEPASRLVAYVAKLKDNAHGEREGVWIGNDFTPFSVRDSKLVALLDE